MPATRGTIGTALGEEDTVVIASVSLEMPLHVAVGQATVVLDGRVVT